MSVPTCIFVPLNLASPSIPVRMMWRVSRTRASTSHAILAIRSGASAWASSLLFWLRWQMSEVLLRAVPARPPAHTCTYLTGVLMWVATRLVQQSTRSFGARCGMQIYIEETRRRKLLTRLVTPTKTPLINSPLLTGLVRRRRAVGVTSSTWTTCSEARLAMRARESADVQCSERSAGSHVTRKAALTAILQTSSSQTKILRVEFPRELPVFWEHFTS